MRALLLLLVGCAASAPAQRPVKTPAVAHDVATADTCPLALSGASLEVKDDELGVALEFTSYEDVAELRRRVRLLGDVEHAQVNHRFVSNTEGGAKIVFPVELKSQVVALAAQMDAGACPTSLPTKADERVVSR